MKNFSKITKASILFNKINEVEEISYIHLRKLSDEFNITKEDWQELLNKVMPKENRKFIPQMIQRLFDPTINNYSSDLMVFSSDSVL